MTKKLLLSLLLISATTITANAATTGSVVINGKVPLICELTVTADGVDDATDGNQDIEDISIANTDRDVAMVRETCNEFDGYTVTMVSTNAGDHTGLLIDTVSSDQQPFTVKYDGSAVSSTTVTDVNAPVAAATGYVDKLVEISFSADPSLAASDAYTYTDTLTFTISAK